MKSLSRHIYESKENEAVKEIVDYFNDQLWYMFLEDEFRNDSPLTESDYNIAINNIVVSNIDYKYVNHGLEMWDYHLYENLIHTMGTEKLTKIISDKFSHYNIEVVKKSFDAKYCQFTITGEDIQELANNENFISTCDLANYEIINNDNSLTIKPIKGKDITNKVYEYPVIYHYTKKFIYENNIKNFGISPKGKSKQKNYGSKYRRIYLFYAKDPANSYKIQSMARLNKRYFLGEYENNENMTKQINDGYVLLTINLNKIKNKLRFFEDSGQKGLNAFWTYDFIPHWSIEKVEDIQI